MKAFTVTQDELDYAIKVFMEGDYFNRSYVKTIDILMNELIAAHEYISIRELDLNNKEIHKQEMSIY